jgi:hypothetical protein
MIHCSLINSLEDKVCMTTKRAAIIGLLDLTFLSFLQSAGLRVVRSNFLQEVSMDYIKLVIEHKPSLTRGYVSIGSQRQNTLLLA